MNSSVKTKKRVRNISNKKGGSSEKTRCDLSIGSKLMGVNPLYTRERLLLAISNTTFFESKKMEDSVSKKILKFCKDPHNPYIRTITTNILECFQKPSSLAKILRESILTWEATKKEQTGPNEFLSNFLFFFVGVFLPSIAFYLNSDIAINQRTFTFDTYTRLQRLSDEFEVILNAKSGEEIKKNLKKVRSNPKNSMIFFKIIEEIEISGDNEIKKKKIVHQDLFKYKPSPKKLINTELFSLLEGKSEIIMDGFSFADEKEAKKSKRSKKGKKGDGSEDGGGAGGLMGMMAMMGMTGQNNDDNNNSKKVFDDPTQAKGNPSMFGAVVLGFVGFAFMLRAMGFKVKSQ